MKDSVSRVFHGVFGGGEEYLLAARLSNVLEWKGGLWEAISLGHPFGLDMTLNIVAYQFPIDKLIFNNGRARMRKRDGAGGFSNQARSP